MGRPEILAPACELCGGSHPSKRALHYRKDIVLCSICSRLRDEIEDIISDELKPETEFELTLTSEPACIRCAHSPFCPEHGSK